MKHTEGPQILSATVPNLVAKFRPGVRDCAGMGYKTRYLSNSVFWCLRASVIFNSIPRVTWKLHETEQYVVSTERRTRCRCRSITSSSNTSTIKKHYRSRYTDYLPSGAQWHLIPCSTTVEPYGRCWQNLTTKMIQHLRIFIYSRTYSLKKFTDSQIGQLSVCKSWWYTGEEQAIARLI